MAAPILPVSSIAATDMMRPAGSSPSGGSFQDVFASAVQTVEACGNNASTSIAHFLSREGEELHTTIMATQQAELSFDLFMRARYKGISAYQEIMRMQL